LPKGRPQSAAEASFLLHVLHPSRHLPAAKVPSSTLCPAGHRRPTSGAEARRQTLPTSDVPPALFCVGRGTGFLKHERRTPPASWLVMPLSAMEILMSLTSSRAAGPNPDLGDMSWYVGGRRSDDCFQSGIGIGRLGRRTSR
jgi:hypothetical protein